MKRTPKVLAKNYLFILLGSALYALAFDWCFVPNGIAFGGVTGIAQLVNHVFPSATVGMLVLCFNVPIFLVGWKVLGTHLLVSSLAATALSSIFIDVIAAFYAFLPMTDPLLACIFGGVLLGLGLGIIFQQGATTGGTDVLARLAQSRMAWLPVGKVLMVIDLSVILLVAAVFRRLDSALYGIVALYVSTLVMDWVLYGMDNTRVAYIISDHPDQIARFIIEQLDHSVTYLDGEGGFSGAKKKVILCAFRQREIVELKSAVQQTDPDAFMIVTPSHEVLGEGFRSYHQEL